MTASLIYALQGGKRFSFGNFAQHVDEFIQHIAR
jgi:hypothetical protein